MTSKLKTLFATTALTATLALAAPAFAAGTAQNTDINNSVTVNYTVGATAQTPVTSNTDTFKVDRKVNFTVTEATTVGTTNVDAGQAGAITRFTITNTSNDTVGFTLASALGTKVNHATNASNGANDFNPTGMIAFVDVNGNGVYDAATDKTFVQSLAADASITVLIASSIPAAATNGQIGGVTLTANVQQSITAAGVATAFANNTAATQDAAANGKATVETVFADTGRDGSELARDDYTVAAAALSVWKSSKIISDLVTTTGTNYKAVPGATVEYCIAVRNTTGAANATSVNVGDYIPANMTYVGTVGAPQGWVTGTVTNFGTATQDCVLSGTSGVGITYVTDDLSTPAPNDAKVTGALGTINGGATPGTSVLIFRATID
jgi:uncharacterized repeat protein (TIGR01451 family)